MNGKRKAMIAIIITLLISGSIISLFLLNNNDTNNEINNVHNEEYRPPVKSDSKEEALDAAKKIVDIEITNKYDLYYKLIPDYTGEAALYAVENVDVDWNKECLEYADQIINKDYFSESQLIFKLSDVGFNREEINYALDELNVDWRAEAVQCAKACRNEGFSPTSLRYNFYTIGFDKELVDYALSQVEYDYVSECEVRISYFMDINDYNEEDTRWELEDDGFDKETIDKAFELRHNNHK